MALERKKLSAEFIIDSFNEYGNDALVFKITEKRSSKNKEVEYVDLNIRTPTNYSGEYKLPDYPIYLKFEGLRTFKCPSPEIRASRKGAGPTYSFKISSVDNKGQKIGLACSKLIDAWYEFIKEYNDKNELGFKIISPIQKTVGTMTEKKTIDDPIIRIKFRIKSKADPTIKGGIYQIVNGRKQKPLNGVPITYENIHLVVTSGVSSGIINFATTMFSQQGISIDASSSEFIINQYKGDEFDTSDFDLSDLGVAMQQEELLEQPNDMDAQETPVNSRDLEDKKNLLNEFN